MTRSSNARDQMITTAVALVRSQGFAATGFAEIIEKSGAPRGSIYHHFPNGKPELSAIVIERAGQTVQSAISLQAEKATSPSDFVRRVASVFGHEPETSKWTLGCPVAATAIEGRIQPKEVRDAVDKAFGDWIGACASAFNALGIPEQRSATLAGALVGGLEGGILVSRGIGSGAAYKAIVEILIEIADGEIAN